MTNILENIVNDKRIEIAAVKLAKPLSSFIDQLVPSNKDMYAALRRCESNPQAGFIFECKKASPSKGLIRPDFDVTAIAKIYDKYAAAISVLTDEKYFQGNFAYLANVCQSVSCPVLNKDFFIDSYQVHLARYYGADAILLMLSVLSDAEYLELANVAQHYNLAILTEISNEQERDRAINLGAKMIGINNRNLRDLSTDISRTFDFAPTLPDDIIIISESGIYTNDQVRELAPAVDGFLVGSSLMAMDNNPYNDIDLACRKLVYGNNKVCGLTEARFANASADAGARFGGLIFAEKSPRTVSIAQAKNIINSGACLEYVGVFVNHRQQDIIEAVKQLNLVAVQLHGDEDERYIASLKKRLNESGCSLCQIWQASTVTTQVPALSNSAVHHVLDGKSPGSGQPFNWQVLSQSEQDLSSTLLAGGLCRENIKHAIAQRDNLDLFGFDLNSGVETSPGIKSSERLQAVFAQLRNY